MAAFAAAVAGLALFAGGSAARAQDDGPRVYQLAPRGAQAFTGFAVFKRTQEQPDPASRAPGPEIDTNLVVLRYVRTLSLDDRQFAPFLIVPTGEARIAGVPVSGKSAGLGDIQVGAVFGLLGSPALSPEDYATFDPSMTMGLLARIYLPTGAHADGDPVNLGSDRVSFQLGLPTTFPIGASYRDPRLTAIEILPTVTFYETRDTPGGDAARETLFSVEAHLTHTVNERFWISGDLLYRQGGETSRDGVGDGNAMRGLSGGVSVAWVVGPKASVILTYNTVIERADDGPDGWFFRTALVAPF